MFAGPTRAEIARADDDSVLKVLMPREDHVLYRRCPSLKNKATQIATEPIAELRFVDSDAFGRFSEMSRCRTSRSGTTVKS